MNQKTTSTPQIPVSVPCVGHASDAGASAASLVRSYRSAAVLWVFGQRVRILADSRDTAGRYALVEVYAPACYDGPPMHVHDDCDELFHILEGGLKITIAGQLIVAHAGDTIIAPRGTPHTFANPFLTPSRFLVQWTPGGFEGFLRDFGAPPANPLDLFTPPPHSPMTPTTAERLGMLAVKYHMRVLAGPGEPGLTE
jgi:mannose-6-phosphate isomerase-like protein (cupin superfamily)